MPILVISSGSERSCIFSYMRRKDFSPLARNDNCDTVSVAGEERGGGLSYVCARQNIDKREFTMSLTRLIVLYGKLEGTEGKFARDPSGHLSIEAGIFRKHGLDVSWQHVQGTEERYHRLEQGTAQISLVVGRASLQHFLVSRETRILGCAMNSCPYYLVANPTVNRLTDLRGRILVCREGPSRNTPLAETFQEQAKLRLGEDLTLQLEESDQDAFKLLLGGKMLKMLKMFILRRSVFLMIIFRSCFLLSQHVRRYGPPSSVAALFVPDAEDSFRPQEATEQAQRS